MEGNTIPQYRPPVFCEFTRCKRAVTVRDREAVPPQVFDISKRRFTSVSSRLACEKAARGEGGKKGKQI